MYLNDKTLEVVGSNGRFQMILSILIPFISAILGITVTGIPYLSKCPQFKCKPRNIIGSNFTECDSQFNCLNQLFEYEKNSEKSLHNFAYSFDLYCENRIYLEIMSSCFFFGGILSTLIFSPLTDKYGRLKIYRIVCLGLAISNINLFLTSGAYHLIFNFLSLGIFLFAYSMSMTLICEFMDKNNAGKVMGINNAAFPLSGIFVALYFMLVNNWRILFLINMVISVIVAYFVFVYMVESPRWLNSKHKFKELRECLMKIAIFNGNKDKFTKFLEENETMLEKEEKLNNSASNKQNKNTNLMIILLIPKFRYLLFCLCFCWWAMGVCFWGLIFNLENLGRSMYIDSIVTFGAEFIAEISSGYYSDIYGRRKVMMISSIFSGICFITFDFFQTGVLKTTLLFFASLGISSIYNVLFIYSPEVFPTSVRSTTNGFFFIASRLGGMMCPYMINFFWRPPVIFGIIAVVAGLVISTLEETLGKELMDNFSDDQTVKKNIYLEEELINSKNDF